MSATILIVDDDKLVQQRLTNLLEKEDHNVIASHGDDELSSALEDDEISVMIIEPHLSERDGLEVIRKAKKASPITQTIILTKEGTM
ncbi:MAG: response regulator [Chloroflexota bacterium]|nr:response regulator [Chloroflexota bacterium]